MPRWVERMTNIVKAGEPETGEHCDRLVMNSPHSLDKRDGVLSRMLERPFEIVDDG
jgi:hypothetical protein